MDEPTPLMDPGIDAPSLWRTLETPPLDGLPRAEIRLKALGMRPGAAGLVRLTEGCQLHWCPVISTTIRICGPLDCS